MVELCGAAAVEPKDAHIQQKSKPTEAEQVLQKHTDMHVNITVQQVSLRSLDCAMLESSARS